MRNSKRKRPRGRGKSDVCPDGQVMICLRHSDVLLLCRKVMRCVPLPSCAKHTSLAKQTSHTKCTSRSAKTEHIVQKTHLLVDKRCVFCGPPEGIRTPGLQNRNLLRYPAAPRAEIYSTVARAILIILMLFFITFRVAALPAPCVLTHLLNAEFGFPA